MHRIFLLLIFITTTLISQENFNFDFDFAQFRFDSTSNYTEVYYSFKQEDLTIVNENGKSFIKAIMHIQIQDLETDELIVNKNWAFDQPIEEGETQPSSKGMLGAIGFILKQGFYQLTISVHDKMNPDIQKEYVEKFSVLPFYRDHFVISDIELASRIINDNADKKSIFYKNTLEVYPNPSIIYTNNAPVLFYYCELYNLNLDNDKDSKLTLNKKLYNSKNDVVYELTKSISKLKESIVDVGVINLQKYSTDTYTLVLTISDSVSNKVVASSKKFFFVNPGVKPKESFVKTSNYLSSEFGVYADEECDDLFEKSRIIATSNEIDEFEDLDSLNQKREFLYKFWKKRDTNPATRVNEFKQAYFSRMSIANARFRTMSSKGYKTDRGRVYLKYGEPDQIDRYPNETNSKPYEIWSYNQIEGGIIFVFGDITGFNYYELLHSTKRGELQDPNWQRRIKAN